MNENGRGVIAFILGGIVVFLFFSWRENKKGGDLAQTIMDMISGAGSGAGSVNATGIVTDGSGSLPGDSSSACGVDSNSSNAPIPVTGSETKSFNSDEGRGIFSIEGGSYAGEPSYF